MHRDPRRHLTRLLRLALLLLAASGIAQAQSVYKCIDRDRHVAYQQTPCAPSQVAQRIEIAPPPPAAPLPAAVPAKAKPRAARGSTRRVPAARVVQSFECRSESGALFYRHTACPTSIPRRGPAAAAAGRSTDRVRATRIPRSDACKRMRSPGRDGREHDEDVSTYERNLGRDPCRRH